VGRCQPRNPDGIRRLGRGWIPRVLQTVCITAVAWAGGCSGEEAPEVDSIGQEAIVSDYYYSTCSTSVVLGLSIQVADEVQCVAPGTLVPFEERDGIVFSSSAVVPYLAQDARDDLYAAAASYGGELRVNSAFRTVVQQFLLYKWYQLGRCGITAAATPGRSNHESGRAIDFGNYGALSSVLPAYGWAQTVLPSDPVHFDHLDSPDLRGYDVLAFQRLWNRNNPGDRIDEDGVYGPQTEARLAMSPPGGFPIGGGCDEPQRDAEYVATGVPERIDEGAREVVWVELRNTGTEPWQPGATFLGTTGPIDRDSALYDDQSWVGPNRPATVDATTAPGEVGRFTFTIAAPEVDADTTVSETFGLVEEGVAWFGPDDVTIELLVIDGGSGGGDGGDDPYDPFDPGGGGAGGDPGDPLVSGGCSAGGSASGWPLALLALAAISRRSRRTRR